MRTVVLGVEESSPMFNLHPTIIIINLLVLGMGMTVHEFVHNYVGWKMGDPVPKQLGRLTLNPLVHINWIGWLMFAIIGFGVLGSAPISPQRMRDPRWGYLAAVASAPFSNLGLAVIAGILLRIMDYSAVGTLSYFSPELITGPTELIAAILFATVYLNVLLFLFNILPLFPLDGWHIVLTLLPGTWLNRMQIPVFIQQNLRILDEFLKRPAYKWKEWQMASYYLFMGLIFISIAVSYVNLPLPNPLHIVITEPTFSITFALIGFG